MTDPNDPEQAETLAGGIASIDEDDEDQQVRIVPIGEGDVTRGGSEKKTYWDRETLRAGVENGAFDDAKLLKGRPGEGHKDMLEQADPDEIVGGAGSFEYENGVGPVSEDAEVLDDHLANLVEAGLVEVSPDMWRVLGEYDEELGAYRVDEILDVPYITILDRGASEGASIEAKSSAEALGVAAATAWSDRTPELAETLGVSEAALEEQFVDVEDPDAEQLGRLMTLRFNAYGEMFGDGFLDEAVENLEAIDGVSATRSQTQDNPELVAIIDREGADLDELNGEIVAALDDTPFEVHEGYDWVEDVAFEGLSMRLGPGGEQAADERAESRAGSGTDSTGSSGGDGPDDGTTPHMADPEELQEQLAEVRSERDDLKDDKDDLEEQLSDNEETIEQLNERIEELEGEVEPLAEMLAELAAADSPLSAEQLADRFEPSELVETLAVDAGWDEDDDEEPVDIVREQLAGSPTPRGEADDPGDPGGDFSDDELEQAEQLADEVMNASDALAADGSNREYLQQTYDVDPAEYNDVEQLRSAVRSEDGD
jgi:TolA-binding protein